MSLTLELAIEPREMRVLEDPLCALTFRNSGEEDVRFPHPWFSETLVGFHVVDVRTGVARLFHKPHAGRVPARDLVLPPGKSIVWHFLLGRRVPLDAAGEYEVRAVCRDEAEDRSCESGPIRIKLRRTAARGLALDTLQGSVSHGVWINLAGDPPEILRSRFDFVLGGGVRDTRVVAGADFGTRPAISVPPNGRNRERHWVAWRDGRVLNFTHVSRELGVAEVGRFEVPDADWEIIPPLLSGPVTSTAIRPEGSALLSGSDGVLRIVRLTAGRAALVARSAHLGPSPMWSTCHVLRDGSRCATLLQATGGSLRLLLVPWSMQGVGPARPLGTWEGGFVAAGATLGVDDAIRGAILVRTEREGRIRHEIFPWRLDAAGGLAQEPAADIAWPAGEPPPEAVVRVSGRGTVAVCLKDSRGRRFLACGGKAEPLPLPLGKSEGLMEPGFLNGSRPVLVAAVEDAGVRIFLPDGRPLPPRPS